MIQTWLFILELLGIHQIEGYMHKYFAKEYFYENIICCLCCLAMILFFSKIDSFSLERPSLSE